MQTRPVLGGGEGAPLHAEVFRVCFWMKSFQSPTPKRTMVVSNWASIASLDLGPLRKQQLKTAGPDRTTKRYVDSQQQQRYSGLPALKQTQPLIAQL